MAPIWVICGSARRPQRGRLNLALVPADRGGPPASSACKFVLVGLANHAELDGVGVFPSVATLVRYTACRGGRCAPAWTGWGPGIIRRCDPDVATARIKRADRRPEGWDLDLSLIRDD